METFLVHSRWPQSRQHKTSSLFGDANYSLLHSLPIIRGHSSRRLGEFLAIPFVLLREGDGTIGVFDAGNRLQIIGIRAECVPL